MPDVSAGLIALSGAVIIIAGSIPSAMTNDSRWRLVGLGFLLTACGVVAWMISFAVTFMHFAKALYCRSNAGASSIDWNHGRIQRRERGTP